MKTFARATRSTILILLGILSAAFGLKGFLLSSHFIDGGVTGISMLLAAVANIPLGILIFFINIPFVIIGYRQIGPRFAFKTGIAIFGLALVLFFVSFPD